MVDLLELAFDDPVGARREAGRVLAAEPDAGRRSLAHQCLGIVHREAGRTKEALAELRAALREAARSGDDGRLSDVRATYAGTLIFAGRTASGLAEFERAAEGAAGAVASRVRTRLGLVLLHLGRNEEARRTLRSALADAEALDDPVWEARARNGLAYAELSLGHLDAAEGEVRRAEQLLRTAGATLEVMEALENQGEIAVARGALADGLRLFSRAAAGYEAAGLPVRFPLVCAHANAYLAAGMPQEAVRIYSEHVADASLPALRKAELHLYRAAALLVAGDPAVALEDARRARMLYRSQGRDWFELRARLAEVRARWAAGDRRGVSRGAAAVAEALHDDRAPEAPAALTVAGRAAQPGRRLDLWRAASSYRRHPNGLVRAGAWLARALEREECADRGGVLRACAAGLDAIDEHRRLMGSSELRALATTHGRELTEVALRHAAAEPRTLLRWSERTRATALAQPPVTSDASSIPASLAALRDNGRRLAEARQSGEATEELERERLRLERAVRAEHHTLPASGADAQRPPSVEEVVAAVGDGCLVELVDVDGELHVLVVHAGRVRRRVAGSTGAVTELLGPAAMLLRRAARGRPAATAELGGRLQRAVLGDAARLLPDGPVVLAPTARLHGVPWALLPTLAARPFTVVPSAAQWLRARGVERPDPRRTLLVCGPSLESGGAEVPVLAERLPGATLLDGPSASVEAVLATIDGADLAHLAAHGRFRADSPLFSALELADGSLTVHDLERLRAAPYRVVLSACESGVLAPVGADELLGLAAALFSLGTAGLVCSVAEVNDAATAELMVGLHDRLAAGADPADALLRVRQAAEGDPVLAGTAAAFVALGV